MTASEFKEVLKEEIRLQELCIDYFDAGGNTASSGRNDSDQTEEEKLNILISYINSKEINKDKDKMKYLLEIINFLKIYHFKKKRFYYRTNKILMELGDMVTNLFSVDEIQEINFNLINFFYSNDDNKKDQDVSEIKKSKSIDKKKICCDNDNEIARIIRDDDIDNFLYFISINNLNIKEAKIPESVYESHPTLIENKKSLTLIDYSAFFGSLKIFKFLFLMDVQISFTSLNMAVEGRNFEIICLLLEKIEMNKSFVCSLIRTSIVCHYNEIVSYFLINFFSVFDIDEKDRNAKIIDETFDSYNLIALVEIIKKFPNILAEPFYASIILDKSIYYGYIDVVKFISEKLQIKYCSNLISPLFIAVDCEKYDIIKYFLNRNIYDVNSKEINVNFN